MSIKSNIRNSMLLVAAAIALAAGASHEFLRVRDAKRSCQVGAALITQTLAQRFESQAFSSPNDLSRTCQKILEIPSVLAISLQDPSGHTFAHAEVNEDLADQLFETAENELGSAETQELHIPNDQAGGRGNILRTVTPLASGAGMSTPVKMGLLLQIDPCVATSAAHFWLFYLPAGIVGLVGFILGWWRVRRNVVQPICELSQSADAGRWPAQGLENKPLCHELGVINKAITVLWNNLHNEQKRSRIVDQRVKTEVAKETRRISRDLKRLQQAIWKDSLTGVLNRRFLAEKYPCIFKTQREEGQDLSLVMLDLDHFKNLNDKQGHEAGDDILRFVGDLLRQCLRCDDFAVRYGGDEFVLILPSVSAKTALVVTTRILTLFAQRAKMMVEVLPVPTMTAGIASLVGNRPANPAELLALADEGLLAAKQTGKRQAVISVCQGLDLKRSNHSSHSDSALSTTAAPGL